MAHSRMERILILAKTYPSPSSQYIETSCVAGITELGSMRRLYPVPFRLIEDNGQFKKWQWIDVRVQKAPHDRRPESHKVFVDTLTCRDVLSTRRDWADRHYWIDRMPQFTDFVAMDTARTNDGLSLALLRPKRVLGLEITPSRHSTWTEEEREKLTQAQIQLFASPADAQREIRELRKIPFDFYYSYVCQTAQGEIEYRHKIVDWEAGALFWNCQRSHGQHWEAPFRAKLEEALIGRDLAFFMGNLHRFQDQWLIVSLIYPPKRVPEATAQGALF